MQVVSLNGRRFAATRRHALIRHAFLLAVDSHAAAQLWMILQCETVWPIIGNSPLASGRCRFPLLGRKAGTFRQEKWKEPIPRAVYCS